MTKTRPIILWGLFALQTGCTAFFLGDSLQDFFGPVEPIPEPGDQLEGLITMCLVLSTVFTGWELWNMYNRERRLRQQLLVASGAFGEILQKEFDAWGLTESEQAVALLGIKGYSIAEIAELRDTKEGTIKAQNAAVYRKAGVSGRLQLLSHFVEDLLADSTLLPKDMKFE